MISKWAWLLLLSLPAAAADLEAAPEALGSIRESFQELRAPAAPEGIACSRPFRFDSHARGAYFRKVESLPDRQAAGIRAQAVLPNVSFDEQRSFSARPGQPAYWEGPLDRPSVYLGGRTAAKEVDAGLSWDRVYDEQGRPTFTDLASGSDGRDPKHRFLGPSLDGRPLRPNFAFRPYWRTTRGSGNQWSNPAKDDPYYFYPGEAVVMTLRSRGDGTMRLDIRAAWGRGRHFTKAFRQEGFAADQDRSFKRVASIDQFRVVDGDRRGNEGQDVLPTRTQVRGLRWQTVSLLRPGAESALAGGRCQEVVGADTLSDYASIFNITPAADGGETVDITPPRP